MTKILTHNQLLKLEDALAKQGAYKWYGRYEERYDLSLYTARWQVDDDRDIAIMEREPHSYEVWTIRTG